MKSSITFISVLVVLGFTSVASANPTVPIPPPQKSPYFTNTQYKTVETVENNVPDMYENNIPTMLENDMYENNIPTMYENNIPTMYENNIPTMRQYQRVRPGPELENNIPTM